MASEMTVEQIKELGKRLENCKKLCEENEANLTLFCDSMIKMCNTCYKIKRTQLLSDVEKMIAPAFPLVVDYFLDRVERCLNESSEKEKVKLRQDIEISVESFSEVFEEIIQATNGADRILFQTAPLDTGIRYTAPKLCAYYSAILNALVELLDEKEYAFCVYPTQASCAEAEMLFTTMNKRGRVCIIRVPANKITEVEHLRLTMLHEFFHVLPGELRRRKQRALTFIQILLYYVENNLLDGVETLLQNWDESEWTKLEKFLFQELTNAVEKNFKNTDALDRCFWGKDITENLANRLQYCLYQIQAKTQKDYFDYFYKDYKWTSYEEYSKKYDKMNKLSNAIKMNVQKVLPEKRLKEACEFYMGIFREVYSDVLSVLTLRRKPKDYFQDFNFAINQANNYEKDPYEQCLLFLRILFVVETLSVHYIDVSPELFGFLEDWRHWHECTSDDAGTNALIRIIWQYHSKYKANVEAQQQGIVQEGNFGDESLLHEAVLTTLMDYEMKQKYLSFFVECCKEYLKYESEKERIHTFASFRDRFGISLQSSDEDLDYFIATRKWE